MHPTLVLWKNPEAWGNKGGLSCVQDTETHVFMWLVDVDVYVKNHHSNT